MKMKSRGDEYTAGDMFGILANSYGECVDLYNFYFVGKDTPFLDREVYNFYGIDLTELMNFYQEVIGGEDDVEKYFDKIQDKLEDESSDYYKKYRLLMYYETYMRSLYANFKFGITIISEASDFMEDLMKKNPDLDDETKAKYTRSILWNSYNLREALNKFARNAYITKCARIEGELEKKIRMNKEKYFYKEVIPEIYRKILACDGLIIRNDQYYDHPSGVRMNLCNYSIIFCEKSRISTIVSIVLIKDDEGNIIKTHQVLRIEDLSFFRVTIGQIHPDMYRNLIGEGYVVDINSKEEFIISTKIIMSLLTLDDEISEFLIAIMKSFNVYEKMEVFETLIDDCKGNIWVELNSTVGFLYMNNANVDEMSIEDRTKLILERERNDPNYFSPILITGRKSQGS